MRKIFTLLAAALLTATIWAQSPEKMSYQAVIRDASDNLITETEIGMQISILQGAVDGMSVYVETQTPTTNANGLVSLEIGEGSIVSGDFTTIDWANGPYFIKTETAPSGGTIYTITGTSQLLSVPYALHAKTAETVAGGITETDPIFTTWNKDYNDLTNLPILFDGDYSSLANLPTLFDGNYNSLTNLPTLFSGSFTDLTDKPTTIVGYGITDAFGGSYSDLTDKPMNATTSTEGFMSSADKTKLDGLENVNITAGTGILVNGIYPNIIITNTATDNPTYIIGLNEDLGGYVFYVTPNGKHGLVAETQDQSTSCSWIDAQEIISNPTNHSTAGKNFTDWRLPTKYELNLMYSQKVNIGNFASASYWSSNEFLNNSVATNSSYYAWRRDFINGGWFFSWKSSGYYVRAVRAF